MFFKAQVHVQVSARGHVHVPPGPPLRVDGPADLTGFYDFGRQVSESALCCAVAAGCKQSFLCRSRSIKKSAVALLFLPFRRTNQRVSISCSWEGARRLEDEPQTKNPSVLFIFHSPGASPSLTVAFSVPRIFCDLVFSPVFGQNP